MKNFFAAIGFCVCARLAWQLHEKIVEMRATQKAEEILARARRQTA